MADSILRIENLSKKYLLRHQIREPYTTLRDTIATGAQSLGRRLMQPGTRSPRSTQEEFWALKDVSFEVKQGDRVGIIGRNGAGKSTLLKILSRITEPTTGRVRIRGRVASLLEVGTGFHPELTGRENIYLNGAILGMGRVEIKRKFDEIVDFAEIEKFLDTPVKRYSSGMYVRLAFAIAAHLEPEILVVDEVLAVGDAQFQKKCLGKMNDVASQGRTVLFVSHNMAAIRALCSTAIMLDKGNIVQQGSTAECITAYEMRNLSNQGSIWFRSSNEQKSGLVITKVSLKLLGKQPNLELDLEILIESRSNHKPAFLAVDITDLTGIAIMQALPKSEGFLLDCNFKHFTDMNIRLPPLIPGQYLVSIWAGSHNTETLDWVKEAVTFEIFDSPTSGRSFSHTADHGYIVPVSILRNIEELSLN